jgi:beta-mannosidase
VEGESARTVSFEVRIGDEVVFRESARVSDGVACVDFRVGNVQLWYPHGYGAQPLYTVAATASAEGISLHKATRRTGFRKGELLQQPDAIGKTFFFRVNGVDVFCGGSDWIPADSFTPRVSEGKYRKWLELMVDGYQVMIRYAFTAQRGASALIVCQHLGRRNLGRRRLLRPLRRTRNSGLAGLHVRLR